MTRTEQAAFRRLEKRHKAIQTAMRIINTWLTTSTANWATPETLCLWIRTLAVDALAADEAAERKEAKRHD